MALTLISQPHVMHTCWNNEVELVIATNVSLSDPNLRVQLIISMEPSYLSGTYSQLMVLWGVPKSDGRVYFKLHEHLFDAFPRDVDVLGYGGSTLVRLAHAVRRWKWTAVEYSGDPVDDTDTINSGSTVYHALRGGIAKWRDAMQKYFDTFPSGWHFAAGTPFIDFEGDRVYTTVMAQRWRCFYRWQSGSGSTILRVVCYWSNGDVTTHDGLVTAQTTAQHEVWAVPVGYGELGLAALAPTGAQLVKYTVQVWPSDLSTAHTKVHTYIINNEQFEQVTMLRYMNSLGTWTDIELRGNPIRDIAVDRDDLTQYWERTDGIAQGEATSVVNSISDGRKHSSGWVNTKTEHMLFAELMLNRKTFAQLGTTAIPVVIKNVKWTGDKYANLEKVIVEFEPAFVEKVPDMLSSQMGGI